MTDLVDALDAAAAKLLEQAGLSETSPEKIEATPAERVKAFDSVLEYAKMRPTLIPKVVTESAFDGIKRKFNGEKAPRGGRAATPETEAGPIVVNGAEPLTGDLFGA